MEPPAKQDISSGNDANAGLSAASAQSLEQLLQRWEQDSIRQCMPSMIVGGLMLVGGCGILLAALLLSNMVELRPLLFLFGGITASFSLMVLNGFGYTFPLTDAQKQILARIEAIDEVSAGLSLADFAHSRRLRAAAPLRRAVLATLTGLLSKMSDADAVSYFRYHSDKLVSLLTNDLAISHPDLVSAILRLLPALADSGMLVPTAHFIVEDAPTHHEQQVREVAREVLPILLARADVGGPESLTAWIQKLPMIVQNQSSANSLTPEQVILPHLAIMKLLPQTASSDFLALSQRTRQRLYANLRHNFLPRLSEQYSLVVLDMICRSADVEALSVVQDLNGGSYMSSFASPYPQVREAARACAVALKEQVEKEKVSKTLLRGASAPDAASDMLLRAASGTSATDPQLLLRANVQQSVGDERTHEPVSSVHQHEYEMRTTQAGKTAQDATIRLSDRQ